MLSLILASAAVILALATLLIVMSWIRYQVYHSKTITCMLQRLDALEHNQRLQSERLSEIHDNQRP